MRNTLTKKLTAFFISLPLVFTLLFFGYLPVRFDAVIYTGDIVGEGSCATYVSSPRESFAYLYRGDAYFGSELKTLRVRDLRYDIDEVTLYFFGVDEAKILSFDISLFGFTVTHVSGAGLTHPFTRTVREAVDSSEAPLVHAVLEKPDDGASVSLTGFAFIPIWFWIAYFVLVLLLTLLLALGVDHLTDRFPRLLPPLFSAAALLTVLILGCWFCGSLPYVNYTDFLLNWLLLYAAGLLLNALTLPWLGSVTVTLVTAFWYIANYFVISFRGKPIMPADLQAFGTAMEVIDGYSLNPSWQMVVSVAIILLYCAGIIAVYRTGKTGNASLSRKLLMRGCTALVAVLLFVGGILSPAFARVNTFAWDARVTESFHREGIVLSFLKNAFNSIVREPDGYSREAVRAYLADYSAESSSGIQPTNIIMVMNEAFSDLRTVGLDEHIDVMPFIDSLDENTIKGDLYVSIIGGGTCNTEFEALTGNTLAFLGIGTYPYTANVTKPMFSLASYFRDSGYVSESFHANKAVNWNRNMVYPFLGFDVFHDIRDLKAFAPVTYLHNLPADSGDYRYMESVKESYGNRPTFFFDVTMQNHSGYEHFLDVEEDATVREYGGELTQPICVYLSLIRASDDAVRQLVEHYRDSDEPTMIVFFGDHQPGMSSGSASGVYRSVQNNLDFYRTKFFIWTNYETPAVHDAKLSANYLPWLILERGGFPLPPFVQMLGEVYEKYPILSAQGVMDAEGNVYAAAAELADDPLIQKYRCVQYANLFDEIDGAWFTVS